MQHPDKISLARAMRVESIKETRTTHGPIRHVGAEAASAKNNKKIRPNDARQANSELHIVSLNVHGLCKPREVTSLGTFLAGPQPQPVVCVLVETYLYRDERDKINYETFRRTHATYRRREHVSQSCGRVLILVPRGGKFRPGKI